MYAIRSYYEVAWVGNPRYSPRATPAAHNRQVRSNAASVLPEPVASSTMKSCGPGASGTAPHRPCNGVGALPGAMPENSGPAVSAQGISPAISTARRAVGSAVPR